MMDDRPKTMVCGPREMNQAVLRHGIAQTCAHYVRHHEVVLPLRPETQTHMSLLKTHRKHGRTIQESMV